MFLRQKMVRGWSRAYVVSFRISDSVKNYVLLIFYKVAKIYPARDRKILRPTVLSVGRNLEWNDTQKKYVDEDNNNMFPT
jgi:hypothetical protein